MGNLRHPPTQPTRLLLIHRGRRYLSDIQEWRLVEFLLGEMLAAPQTPAAFGPILRALYPLTKWHRWRLHAAGAKDRQEFARQLRLAACLEFPAPPPPRYEYRVTLDGKTWRSPPVERVFHRFYRDRLAVADVSTTSAPIALIFPPWPCFWGLWARARSHRSEILRQLQAGPSLIQEPPR